MLPANSSILTRAIYVVAATINLPLLLEDSSYDDIVIMIFDNVCIRTLTKFSISREKKLVVGRQEGFDLARWKK